MTLKEKLQAGKFVVTVELDPPKGAAADRMIAQVRQIRQFVDAVNIADCPMANLRMSPIALAHVLQQDANIETIFHLTCRDRNLIGLQAELLGAGALGVQNILTLTGDTPDRGDHPHSSAVFETDSSGLIQLAATLNQGKDSMGNMLEAATNFFIGSSVNPSADNLDCELDKLAKKIQAGVHFVQTQPVFDLETAVLFLDKVKDWPIYIIMGILPLRSYKMACYLHEKVPGITVPAAVLQRMADGGREQGIAIARELSAQLRTVAHGVHIMPLNDMDMVVKILA